MGISVGVIRLRQTCAMLWLLKQGHAAPFLSEQFVDILGNRDQAEGNTTVYSITMPIQPWKG